VCLSVDGVSLTDVVSVMGFGLSSVTDDVLAPGENRPGQDASRYSCIKIPYNASMNKSPSR